MPSASKAEVDGSGIGRISMVAVDVGAASKKLKVLALNPKVTCPGLVAVKVAVARGVGAMNSQRASMKSHSDESIWFTTSRFARFRDESRK